MSVMVMLAKIGCWTFAVAAGCLLIYLKYLAAKRESDHRDRKSGLQGLSKKID
jgi:hypothetical protein